MMKKIKKYFNKIVISCIYFCFITNVNAQSKKPLFKVIAFYSAKSDLAHISFVHEANKWFPQMGALYNFSYQQSAQYSPYDSPWVIRAGINLGALGL